jgi:fructose-1,6-bisphosphatase/inositol monophosphatase family enzyme
MSSEPILSSGDIQAMSNAIQVCFLAQRKLILSRAGKTTFTDKHDGSPVTLSDAEVEDAIISQFKETFPDIPIFGEESGYETDLPETFWLIDPIDGTSNFIANIPTFTCMGVLVHKEQSIASVIYNPSTEDMFLAFRGKGAYKNNQKLNLSETPISSIAYSKGRHIEALDQLLAPFTIRTEIAPNGAGYGFSAVAEGSIAVRFQLHSRGGVHDYAPGALLVEEAGGAIIPILEPVYRYDTKSFVACHPSLKKLIQSSVKLLRDLEE